MSNRFNLELFYFILVLELFFYCSHLGPVHLVVFNLEYKKEIQRAMLKIKTLFGFLFVILKIISILGLLGLTFMIRFNLFFIGFFWSHKSGHEFDRLIRDD